MAEGGQPYPRLENDALHLEAEIDRLLEDSFFVPSANRAAHRELKSAARRLVPAYVARHAGELYRIWESERPFELRLDGITVTGRADVILDDERGRETALAILDYQTSSSDEAEHELQLQVYADAGRREEPDVRAEYVHDLKESTRWAVEVTGAAVGAAEQTVRETGRRIRERDFRPNPRHSLPHVRGPDYVRQRVALTHHFLQLHWPPRGGDVGIT